MKNVQRFSVAVVFALILSSTSFAGTITGSRTTGTITGSRAGTITGSKAGTITGSRAGTITGSAPTVEPVDSTTTAIGRVLEVVIALVW
jgi:outer membrane lipoprotein SlyB